MLYIYVCVNAAYILMTITFLPLCRSSYSFTHIERQENWLQFKPWTLYGIAAKKKTEIATEFHDDPLPTIHFPLPSFVNICATQLPSLTWQTQCFGMVKRGSPKTSTEHFTSPVTFSRKA